MVFKTALVGNYRFEVNRYEESTVQENEKRQIVGF